MSEVVAKPEAPQVVPITAEVAMNVVGNYLDRQHEDGQWHREMQGCMVYLYRNAKENEDRKQAENQIPT